MLRAVAEEIRGLDTGRKALRQFGLVVGGVFAGLALVSVWRHEWSVSPTASVLGTVGGALLLFGLAAPALLRPVYRAWMGLAFALGFVMTRVLLTVVFVGLVVPIAVVLRLVRKDLLGERLDRRAPSYWQPKTYADPSPTRLEKYY